MYDERDEKELLLELSKLLVLDELVEITDEASLSSFFASLAAIAWACAKINLGAFFKNSLIPSVNGPRPILVKKLIAYRVLRALSFGNMPLNHSRVGTDGCC